MPTDVPDVEGQHHVTRSLRESKGRTVQVVLMV